MTVIKKSLQRIEGGEKWRYYAVFTSCKRRSRRIWKAINRAGFLKQSRGSYCRLTRRGSGIYYASWRVPDSRANDELIRAAYRVAARLNDDWSRGQVPTPDPHKGRIDEFIKLLERRGEEGERLVKRRLYKLPSTK